MNESKNDDIELVISTVISTVSIFFDKYPQSLIYFRGSNPARTRLYRAVIAKQMEEMQLSYQILGLKSEDSIEVFDKKHTYIGYLIQKKHEKEN